MQRLRFSLAASVLALAMTTPALASQQPLDLQILPTVSRAAEGHSIPVFLASDRFTLELDRTSVRSGEALHRGLAPAATYRGRLAEEPGSLVVATAREGVLRAMVWRAGESDPWWIMPSSEIDSSLPGDIHTAVHTRDLPPSFFQFDCGVESSDLSERAVGGASKSAGTEIADVLIEADYEYFTLMGSVLAAEDAIEEAIFFTSAIYEHSFGLRLRISHLKVWDIAADPYVAIGDSWTLTEFNAYAKNNYSVEKWDIAQLFTGRSMVNAGVAYLSKFCVATGFKRASSWVRPYASPASVVLTAHEMGHNLGANHCSGSDCGIMFPSLSGPAGAQFGPQSIAAITGHPYFQDCTDPSTSSSALPTLGSVAPLVFEALVAGSTTETMTLAGTGLGSTHQVDVDGQILTLYDFQVISDQSVLVETPTPTVLGPVQVSALNAEGWSNQDTITYVATSPPRMNFFNNGYPLGALTNFGGSPGVAYQILLSVTSTTAPLGGVDVLVNPVVTVAGVFDSVGLSSEYLMPAAGTYWIQLLTRNNGALYATTPVQFVY